MESVLNTWEHVKGLFCRALFDYGIISKAPITQIQRHSFPAGKELDNCFVLDAKATQFFKSVKPLNLPLDIIEEILIRASVKSLLRFRCVSKSWCTMIDSSRFIHKHIQHSTETITNHHFIVQERDYCKGFSVFKIFASSLDIGCDVSLNRLTTPCITNEPNIAVGGSCNGLILLDILYKEDLMLWNPFTRRYKKIPFSPTRATNSQAVDLIFGFGYDDIHDDYKVVKIKGPMDNGHELSVYSLKTNTWTWVTEFIHPNIDVGTTQYGVYASCAVHWVVYTSSDDRELLVYNFGTEELKILSVPDGRDDQNGFRLLVIQGSLCLLSSPLNGYSGIAKVYRYDEEKQVWNKLWLLDLADLPVLYGSCGPYMATIDPKRHQKIILQDYLKQNIILYDLQEKEGSTIRSNKSCAYEVEVCLESLVSLGEDTGIQIISSIIM